MLYVILADGEFDQVCETIADARRERKDLKKIGCTVRVVTCADWSAVDALEQKLANKY